MDSRTGIFEPMAHFSRETEPAGPLPLASPRERRGGRGPTNKAGRSQGLSLALLPPQSQNEDARGHPILVLGSQQYDQTTKAEAVGTGVTLHWAAYRPTYIGPSLSRKRDYLRAAVVSQIARKGADESISAWNNCTTPWCELHIPTSPLSALW
jgi:hypothetical protein